MWRCADTQGARCNASLEGGCSVEESFFVCFFKDNFEGLPVCMPSAAEGVRSANDNNRGENECKKKSSCSGCATPNVNTLDPESQGSAEAFVVAIEKGWWGRGVIESADCVNQDRIEYTEARGEESFVFCFFVFLLNTGGEVLQRDDPSPLHVKTRTLDAPLTCGN